MSLVKHTNPISLIWKSMLLVPWLLLASGCLAPMGADRVPTRQAYQQVEANALNSGRLSAGTLSVLHRFNLDRLAENEPTAAVAELHQRAITTDERGVLFALSELSYLAGDHVRRDIRPWSTVDARDYYLGAAAYAYLFLFGAGKDALPGAFDRRFRIACDLYNYGLGLALTERRSTNATVRLEAQKRSLPIGAVDVQLNLEKFPWPLDSFEQFLLADQFRVRGLSVRNREAGVGAPLIALGTVDPGLRIRRAAPVTVFLRLPGSLREVASGQATASLELYSGFEQGSVEVAGVTVPLEEDSTVQMAYTLNQTSLWQTGRIQFLNPSEGLRSQLILSSSYQPGRVPLVFVHGTFSSPVWWAEMMNTLRSDPTIRQRYQIWQFLYSSSNPLVYSAVELREALAAMVDKLDPGGNDPALRQMVVVGHSQGGLLTKLTATDTSDKLWLALSTNKIEDLDLQGEALETIRRYFFFKPLPFVRRVVFISTPHRGSYLTKNVVRRLAHRFVSLPNTVIKTGNQLLVEAPELQLPHSMKRKIPTSLDSMSPSNPLLVTLADLPVAPSVTAHSIIPVRGTGEYETGRDGVVAYQSAHVEYVDSELIVRCGHSCQDHPVTIEEVRRILHEHLASFPPEVNRIY